ncbi:hypothetical protein J4447_00585 [Candidatus Pacearchaeota archaeon]|nr:hypothetical protein [Candidatus Pacearchaeota archaeon]
MAALMLRSIDDLVVIVDFSSDRQHHGRIGKVVSSNPAAGVTWIVNFADGSAGSFADADKALRFFYRKFDKVGEEEDKKNCGPKSFVRMYHRLTYQGNTKIKREYRKLFGEDFDIEGNL